MGAWLLLLVAVACAARAAQADCSFNHKNLLTKQPLLLPVDGQHDARGFVRVGSTGIITLETNEKIVLACPGVNNYLQNGNVLPVQNVTVSCVSGYSFTDGERTITLNLVQCALEPLHEARETGYPLCALGLTHVEVGFRLPAFFLQLYEVCLEAGKLSPAGTHHYVVSGGRSTRTSTTISAYGYAQLDPSKAYVRDAQTQSFTVEVGETNAKKYITTTVYLEPGYLSPIEDFIYGPHRLAVYYYLNSVPQWRAFNSGFWRTLENSIRDLAATEGDLDVYTSPVGVTQLPDALGQATPVYLHADANGTRLMPLPEYMIKLVENEKGQQVLFVTIKATSTSRASLYTETADVCEDACAQLRWLPWRDVPATQRPVACCRADDQRLLRGFPRLVPFLRPRAAAAAAPGLLTGR